MVRKNYGSILTYYGLNRAIESLGFNVLMVHEPTGYNGYRVNWPDDILSMQFARRAGYNYTQQVHYSQLPSLNDDVDTFVVGSDQLWNPLIGRVNDDLFLNFVSPENRRVAYATSFGNRGIAKFKPEFIDRQSPNLQQFNAISVREKYAVNTARDVFGVHADLVVDPVFLLPREHYQTLAQQATATVSGDYLAVFFLDPSPEKISVAETIADKLGLKRIVVIPNPDGGRKLVSQLFQGDRFAVLSSDSPRTSCVLTMAPAMSSLTASMVRPLRRSSKSRFRQSTILIAELTGSRIFCPHWGLVKVVVSSKPMTPRNCMTIRTSHSRSTSPVQTDISKPSARRRCVG